MPLSRPRLVALPLSPWSERARWALDHHRIDYELVQHVPLLGERRLRRLVGPTQARATVPVLVLPGAVLTESWDIVRHADRHGYSQPLLPADRIDRIREYVDLADRMQQVGRALVLRALLASGEALDETLPPTVPAALRPWLRPISRQGARWFARKYELRFDAETAQREVVRAALLTLRERLSGTAYLLGSFTYADIVMAVSLQSVSPVAQRYIRLGPATRRVWSSPELAAEFADLIAWRDQLYENHRLPAAAPVAAASPPSLAMR